VDTASDTLLIKSDVFTVGFGASNIITGTSFFFVFEVVTGVISGADFAA
jgi:hypothetical protein